ncbi:MAG: hypothetical protein DRJ43_02440 [Thermoprotei archaeon]|nr:MAG: hypothetical protein DRJ43_02440 [Thermoprotei archaeon]
MSEEYRVGLLGTGFAGRAHAHAILEARRFSRVLPKPYAVYSSSWERARDFALRFMFEKSYTSWRDLISDPGVKLVINALPNYEHLEPSLEAIERGIPVLVEKPLGRSLDEALEIAKASTRNSTPVAVGFNHRWLPAVQLLAQMVKRGLIGRVRYFRGAFLEDWAFDPEMEFSWRFSDEKAGYGVIGDNGSHVIDLARLLVGEIARVNSISRTFIHERPSGKGEFRRVTNDDVTAVIMEFEGGAIGVLESGRILPGRVNYMKVEVYGDKGALMFDLERPDELLYADYTLPEEERGLKRIRVTERSHPSIRGYWGKHSVGWAASFSIQLSKLLESLENGRDYRPDAWDGAAVNAVLDAIKTSIREERWVSVKLVRRPG